MHRVLPSFNRWRREHGFAVVCGQHPGGEVFTVVLAELSDGVQTSVQPWHGRSEVSLREHLHRCGRPLEEIDQALAIGRAWATTSTLER